jgi:selenocysteine lyase/cysteine desulfurase
MNEQIRALFPVTEKYVYLNSAAVSPPPTTAIEAAQSQLRDVQMHGTVNFGAWLAMKEKTRKLLAGLLGARPEQVALMRNTSDGLSSIANGLDWQAGDNIVTFSGEFPSNALAWLNLRGAGVEARQCAERGGRVDVEELLSFIDGNTRLVALSFVQYGSGFRADLERIGRAARARDALFVVDTIQGLGVSPVDVEAQFVDAAAGAGHKWLMTPEGVGYLYLSDRARERVKPTLLGWVSVADPDAMGNTEQELKPGALAWESGTFSASLAYAMRESLKLLTETGVERIAAYLEELTDYLCEGLAAKDYEIASSRRAGEKSHIVCARHRDQERWPAMALYKHLEAHDIITSPRLGRLRVAPHFYNTLADIDALLAALP